MESGCHPQLSLGRDSVVEKVGKMIAPLVGVSVRGGEHVGGDWNRQQWMLGAGIRFIMIPGMKGRKP